MSRATPRAPVHSHVCPHTHTHTLSLSFSLSLSLSVLATAALATRVHSLSQWLQWCARHLLADPPLPAARHAEVEVQSLSSLVRAHTSGGGGGGGPCHFVARIVDVR